MTTCSYTTLGRYDKRARSIEEIRDCQRHKVEKARHQAKLKRLLLKRESLLGYLIPEQISDNYYDEEFDDYHENSITIEENQNINWNQQVNQSVTSLYAESEELSNSKMNDWNSLVAEKCDGQATQNVNTTWADATSWCEESTWSCSPRVDTPNSEFVSTSSNCSRSTSPSQYNYSSRINIENLEIPDYILQDGERPKRNRDKNSRKNNKNTKNVTSKSKLTNHRSHQDDKKVLYEFETLLNVINTCLDSTKLDEILSQHWKILLEVLWIDNPQEANKAVSTLTYLLELKLLSSDIILNLLQHGLILAMRSCIYRYDTGYADVLKFLVTLARSYSQATPYMIELLTTSPIMMDLHEKLELGETDHIQVTLEFYHILSEMLMSQLQPQTIALQPLIPKILLQTGVTDKINQSYGPLASLTKLLDPKMIELLISNCLTPSFSTQENIMTMIFVILANALKVSCIISFQDKNCLQDELNEWSASVQSSIKSERLINSVKSLRNSWTRALRSAESSEHYSQGIGMDGLAGRLLSLSGQFVEFFEQMTAQTRLPANNRLSSANSS